MSRKILDWDRVLTKTQRVELVNASVRALTELVEAKEVSDLLECIRIASFQGRSLYLTPGHRLKEIHRWTGADWFGWTTERVEYDVTNKEYEELITHYKLTPLKFEKIRGNLK